MAVTVLSAAGTNVPPITDYGPTNEYGAAVQRSMRLMAESPAERKRMVKVLFYGQAVTQQPWSFHVGDWLKERYSNANILYTNLAIGYTAQTLSKVAEADILQFYPDLLIYQNYGNIADIESIIARTRARTTADILIQNEHPLLTEDLSEDTNALTASTIAARRSYIELPALAEKYGAELCDVRTPWKRYLIQNGMVPSDVLRDQIHPSYEGGDYLMSAFVKSHLRVDGTFPDTDWRRSVQTIRVPAERWNSLTKSFFGNRIDVVLSRSSTAPVQVRIDGKRPSEFPELYAFSRPTFYPKSSFPALLQVGKRAPLLEESWTAKVTESFLINGWPAIRYSVTGSKTGFDGEGMSRDPFVSNSGRISLETGDWLMLVWAPLFSREPLPVGHEIKWECRFNGVDEFVPTVVDPTLESTIVLAQGLAHGPHTLTLAGADTSAIEAIRIYNPLARIQPASPAEVRIESVSVHQGIFTIRASESRRYVVEQSDTSAGPWTPLTAPLTDRTFTTAASHDRQFLRLRKID